MNRKWWLTGVFGTGLILSACGGGGGGGGSDPDPDPSANGCPAGFGDFGFLSCEGNVFTVAGTIDRDFTMDPSRDWRLDGVVRVGTGNVAVNSAADVAAVRAAGVDLTVLPGTHVKGLDDGVLLVTRGSRLIADGTASAPITFSSLDDNFDGLGEWGGVVIQGFAPQYGTGNTGACYGSGTVCNVEGEGGGDVTASLYGGNDPADNSGVIRYVRIAEGGLVAGPNNEVNGLTLQGVGHGTTVEYVQVHNNLDDGVEWFGGTVNARYLVLTGNDDDDIDFDEGWVGNVQYAIVRKDPLKEAPTGSNDPRGIEANSSDADYVPQTHGVLANITLIGSPVTSNEPGMRLRGALTTAIYNTAVKDFGRSCVRIDDANTDGQPGADAFSDVTLVNVRGDCPNGFYSHRAADTAVNTGASTLSFDEAYAVNESVAVLSGPATIVAANNGSSFVFDPTDYIGAVEPGTPAGQAWWAGWTIPGSLSAVEEAPATADFVSCNASNTVCTVTGTIDEDYVFTRGTEWRLDGVVRVGTGNVAVNSAADVAAVKAAGVILTIRPGVDVKGLDDGVLLVTRGSKLIADGSRTAPITFSSLDDNFDGLGEWGGVVIQGFAPQYGTGNTGACYGSGTVCNVEGEGGGDVTASLYGGNDPADNSGVIRYVRIAEGGLVAGPNNEVNGLTLQGVGHGTTVEYVQVHNNLDDGVEWFGGTVNARYLVLTGNDDDDIDYDEGWMGNVQFAIVEKNPTKPGPTGSNDPRGIEANSSDTAYVPQTNGTLANLLLIGSSVSASEPGMRLRGALTTAIYNTAVKDFGASCVRIDDANTDGQPGADAFSDVTLVNVRGNCTNGFYSHRAADTEVNVGAGSVTVTSGYALSDAAASLAAATTVPAVNNGSGFVFEATNYIGAVAPGTSAQDAWWSGWTIPGSLSLAP